MNNPLKNLIEVIKTGSPQEVKEAQKKVEKFWHEVYIPKREEGRKAFTIFLEEIKKFEEIQDIEHQAYFINTLKRPFWSIGEEYFEEWAEFILKYIQHPSGKIRQAVVKAADYLIMDIMADLRFDSNKEITQVEKERVEKNKNRFCQLVYNVENLLEEYDEPKFHRYKYITSIPPSVYKSLQKLLVEVLLRNEYYEELYQRFLSSLNVIKTPKLVSAEKNLQKLLEKYKLSGKLTLETISDWIWNDEGESTMDASNRFQKKWFKYFSNIKDIDELNKVLQVFVDAWNYFPHRSLGGKSPDQRVREELKKQPSSPVKDNKKMPNIVIGGRKMSWDKYWSMIVEMENLQKPFKKFVEKELLPRYEKFLRENFSPKIMKKHMKIADIFFRRAMHVGFIEFKGIRQDFIQKEFPKWWQTHVLMNSLNEEEVLSSLKELFKFLTSVYGIDIKRFGFE